MHDINFLSSSSASITCWIHRYMYNYNCDVVRGPERFVCWFQSISPSLHTTAGRWVTFTWVYLSTSCTLPPAPDMEVSVCDVTSFFFAQRKPVNLMLKTLLTLWCVYVWIWSTSTCTRIRTYSYDRGGLFTDVISDNTIIGLRSEISLFDVVLS